MKRIKYYYSVLNHNQDTPNQTFNHIRILALCFAILVYVIQAPMANAQTKDVGSCSGTATGAIGTGTNTSGRNYTPVNNYYNYGCTQIIYDPAELNCTGKIKGIAFQYAPTTAINRTVQIYVGERTSATFGSTSDWTAISTMQLVYSGTMSFTTTGWHWFTFTNLYSYSGTGYLVVAIVDNTGSYTSTNNTFYYSTSSGNKILYARRDGSAVDIASLPTGTRDAYRPNTKFCIDCCSIERTLTFDGTPSTSMTYGSTQQLSVAPYTGGGDISWMSSNSSILSVSGEGLVTAVGPGTATVSAILGRDGDYCGAAASVEITVLLGCTETFTLSSNIDEEIICGNLYCFYDSGGPDGNYGNSQVLSATFSSAGVIHIKFFSFETESNYDKLTVTGTSSDGTYSGTMAAGTEFVSNIAGGSVELTWTSDSYTNKSGWMALITAEGCCPITRTLDISGCSPGDSYLYDEFDLTATPSIAGGEITWSSSNPSIAEVDENTGHVRLVGLGTTFVKARIEGVGDICPATAKCEITSNLRCDETIKLNSSITQEIMCGTNYCFYDSGGPESDYSASQNYTATFTSNGEITISFFEFSSESSSYDYMYIYDGDESGEVLLNKHGGVDNLPSPNTMTAISGTMTVVWKSDSGIQKSGWTALITAEGCCASPRTLTMYGCPESNLSIGQVLDLTATPSTPGGDITWSSSNDDVATVDADGHVATINAGTTVIKARIEELGDLCPAYVSCEVTVSCGAYDKTVGTGNTTNHFFGPVNVAYKYSYRQIIYPQDELCKGVINGMAFNYALSTPMTIKNDVDIYVGERTDATFSNDADWSLPYDMELVYSGPINCTSPGWKWILFDTPYAYSGTKNLVVAIHDKSGTTSSSLYSNFYCTEGTTNIQLHVEGNSPYDLSNVSTLNSEYRMKYRPNTKFCIDCCTYERTGTANFKFCKEVIGLTVGGTITIEVEGADEVSPSGSVVYSTSNPAVATVAADGTVTAVGNGSAIIKATIPAGDPAGYCAVTAKYIVNVGGGLPVYESIGEFVTPPGLYNYFPIDAIFHHTWEQMIFNKNLFENCGCMIKGITFFSNRAVDYTRSTRIFVRMTDKDEFENSYDFVPETGTPDWSGNWNIVAGENTFTFATPVPYDCSKNLLIGVDCDELGAHNQLDYSEFLYTETDKYTGIEAYHEYYDINIEDITTDPNFTYDNTPGRISHYRRKMLPDIRIQFIDCPPTVMPTVSIDPATQQICSGGYISPITVTATGGAVSFSPSLPTGLSYNEETHEITGAIEGGAGSYNFNVVVTAQGGCFSAQTDVEVRNASLEATLIIGNPD